jgi:hypothetical protein
MASFVKPTDTINFTDNTTNNVRNTYTVPLFNQINAGNTIKASHMNTLRDFVSKVRSHTHTLVEFSAIGVSGNLQQTTEHNRISSKLKTSSGTIPWVLMTANRDIGEIIRLSHFQSLRNPINEVITHKHEFNDT